jgi:hypothetical protein
MTDPAKIAKGMPDWKTLAMSYESALNVKARKSSWMALYLRARRDGDSLIGFYRRNHLAGLRP